MSKFDTFHLSLEIGEPGRPLTETDLRHLLLEYPKAPDYFIRGTITHRIAQAVPGYVHPRHVLPRDTRARADRAEALFAELAALGSVDEAERHPDMRTLRALLAMPSSQVNFTFTPEAA